jgi:hypothetical protein
LRLAIRFLSRPVIAAPIRGSVHERDMSPSSAARNSGRTPTGESGSPWSEDLLSGGVNIVDSVSDEGPCALGGIAWDRFLLSGRLEKSWVESDIALAASH